MEKITLSEINTDTKEGRYLIAALAKLTTESQNDKTPDEVLNQCYLLQEEIFKKKPYIIIKKNKEIIKFLNEIEKFFNDVSDELKLDNKIKVTEKSIVIQLIKNLRISAKNLKDVIKK